MDIEEHDQTLARLAARMSTMECDLREMKQNIHTILYQCATKPDLSKTESDIKESVWKFKNAILMCIVALMIMGEAIYPIIHSCK